MKNYSIQALKAICALVVFFSHALNFPDIPLVQKLMHTPFHLFFDGQVAVIIFVVIGGFFYQKKQKVSVANYAGGVKKKFLRIYSPYILVTLIGALMCNLIYDIEYDRSLFTKWCNAFWNDGVQIKDVLLELTAVLPHNTDLINPPSWYVPVEVRLFLVVPIVVMLANAKRFAWLLFIPFIAMMIMGISIYVGACLIGCISKILYDKYHEKAEKLKYKGILQTSLLIVALLLLNVNNEVSLPQNVAFTIQVIGAALLVPAIYSLNTSLTANKALVWFGDLSYEFYLIHFIVLLALRPFYYGPISFIVVTFMLSVGLSVLIKKGCDLFIAKTKDLDAVGLFRKKMA